MKGKWKNIELVLMQDSGLPLIQHSEAYQSLKPGYGTQYSSAKGMLTGTWDKLSDGSGWIKTTCYYDEFGNLVQKRSTNPKNGYDYEYYSYNYINQVKNKYTEHTAFGQPMITEEYTYSYDAQSRLTSVNYKFNGGTEMDIAEYRYDDLGRLKTKRIGDSKEIETFKYNLRGWETEQAGQRFSENLYYESGSPKSGGVSYYGGNISALTWKAEPSMATPRGYSFKYNALGWLTDAVYGEGAGLNSGTLKYDEYFSNFDKNGNIKMLQRYGLKDDNSFGIIDDLTVTEFQGNQIRRIADAAGNQTASDVMEFKYNSEPLNDGHYFYNGAGALMVDYHKRICMMKYNYLTMPQSVQFRRGDRIEYVYDASGVKRQETHKVSNRDMNYGYWSLDEPTASDFDASKTVTTDYFGNKIYVNNQLKYVLTEEGYMEKTGNTFTANYYLNDHLGNHRIVMDANGTVKQVNNYYPSGTSMAERRTDQGVQPYKFGGKELDRTNGLDFYDFVNRGFDPVLMRFTRTDPMAGKYSWISPLAYCANNPVNIIDPTGKSGEAVIDEQNKTITVNMHMVYYGTAATTDIAKRASTEIQTMWNAANGKMTVNNVEYSVSFNVTSEVVSEDKASEMAASNTSAATNFVRVEENGSVDRSAFQLGGNAGYFVTSDNLGNSTTTAHEIGHGFGLDHPNADQRGNGRPEIMAARGTLVDADYQYDKNAAAGAAGGTINPTTRTVQQKNITGMFNGVQFVNGRANVGRATNTIYNLNGTVKR